MSNDVKTPEMPDWVDKSFDNMNVVLSALDSDSGYDDLGIDIKNTDKTHITRMGVMLDVDDEFFLVVMPHNSMDRLRKSILIMAAGIRSNFPHLLDELDNHPMDELLEDKSDAKIGHV